MMRVVFLVLLCCVRRLCSYRSPRIRSHTSSYKVTEFLDDEGVHQQHPVVARRLNPVPERNVLTVLRGFLRRTKNLRNANVSSLMLETPARKEDSKSYDVEVSNLIRT